jgi:hypothetical protein
MSQNDFYNEFKDLDQKGLNEKLFSACENEEFDKVHYLLKSPKLKQNAELDHDNNNTFGVLFFRRKFRAISHLVLQCDIPMDKNIKKTLKEEHTIFILNKLASSIKNLFDIRELNKRLKNNDKNVDTEDLSRKLNKALVDLCQYTASEQAKYLLTSPDLVLHAQACGPDHLKEYPIILAFFHNNQDLIKYLLTSPDLEKHADLHAAADRILKNSIDNERMETIEDLIFNYKIEHTPAIDNMLKEYKNPAYEDIVGRVRKMFLTREINDELVDNKEQPKKFKL